MYIVATFEYSNHLELAISDIERMGVPKYKILAVPLDKRVEKARMFDSIHRSDGVSILDVPAVCATIFMLLGVIYGFQLAWGPILWGIIGLITGILIGLFIKLFNRTRQAHAPASKKKDQTEVVLMINCKEEQVERINDILWEHNAFGIGELNKG